MFGHVAHQPARSAPWGTGSVPAAPLIDELAPRAQRPFWSVMIPVYNPTEILRDTLKCVLDQDPGANDMEIEVVDNCSTQGDVERMVREVAGTRVRFHRQPANVGAVENFNTCIRRASGQWVHVLHGDDIVRPGFYAQAQQAIRLEPEADALACRPLNPRGSAGHRPAAPRA